MIGQTVTSVHSEADMRYQRWKALTQDQCTLTGLSVYAQIVLGFSLYLYDHVSTPGYFSLLLTLPYAVILGLLGFYLAKHTRPGMDGISSAVGKKAAKAIYPLFSLLSLLDAQLAFYALCAMMRDVMPDHSPLEIALAIAVITVFTLGTGKEYALPRASRLLKWLVGLLLLYCLVISIPYGRTAHFFPVFGDGVPSIGRGGLWMCGTLSAAFYPLIVPQHEKSLSILRKKRGTLLRPLTAAFGAALLTYLVSVWLMPFYVLSKPEDLGWRLLLVVHMTPSVPAWSMEVIGLMLLFLAALSHSLQNTVCFLTKINETAKTDCFLYILLLFLLAPVCVLSLNSIEGFLIDAASWRSVLTLFLFSFLALSVRLRNGKTLGQEAV